MARFTPQSTAPVPERAVLVGVDIPFSVWPTDRSLDELERLAHTAGAESVARITQRLDHPVPKSYIGSGKVEELRSLVRRIDADVVIFDDDLTPSQQSYLERAIGEPIKIIDRTALILDIFGLHAKTREGRIQVQLAQLQYLLPRLRGMWSHLAKEQTRGGIGSRFGQGESQLEIDRRMIRNRITALRRELSALEKRRMVQSKQRSSSNTFRVSLAGYTNAGKSSLLNCLTGSDVLSEDKLFATLDPTTRSFTLPGGRTITITDTVGFIQKLPHGLVEAFKSTLGEVRSSDVILKVIDISDPDYDRHLRAVDSVLEEISANEIPCITVYNKADLLEEAERFGEQRLRVSNSVLCSTRTGYGIDELVDRISKEAASRDVLMSCVLPYHEGSLLALVKSQGTVISEAFLDTGMHIACRVPLKLAALLDPYRSE